MFSCAVKNTDGQGLKKPSCPSMLSDTFEFPGRCWVFLLFPLCHSLNIISARYLLYLIVFYIESVHKEKMQQLHTQHCGCIKCI